jgi:hypothetical protein
MRTLLLNSPAGHASRTFVDQKTARPDQVPLLVGHHHFGETETFHQQASGAKIKKTVSKMLTICSLSGPDEKEKHEQGEQTNEHLPCIID